MGAIKVLYINTRISHDLNMKLLLAQKTIILFLVLGLAYVYYSFNILPVAGENWYDPLPVALLGGLLSKNSKDAFKITCAFAIGNIVGLLYLVILRIINDGEPVLSMINAVVTLTSVTMLPWIFGLPAGYFVARFFKKRSGAPS